MRMKNGKQTNDLLRAIAKRNGWRITSFRNEDDVQCVDFSDAAKPMPIDGCLDSSWAFSDASNEEAAAILRFWLRHETRKSMAFGFDLACHLGRLLAERGRLVYDLLEPVLLETDWRSYASPQILLAGLAAFPDGAKRAVKMLDIVPEDARDGLFLACWHLPALAVQRKLRDKFEEWSATADWGGGTGEAGWLHAFLCKWIAQRTFPLCRLDRLVRWNAQREFGLLTSQRASTAFFAENGAQVACLGKCFSHNEHKGRKDRQGGA